MAIQGEKGVRKDLEESAWLDATELTLQKGMGRTGDRVPPPEKGRD